MTRTDLAAMMAEWLAGCAEGFERRCQAAARQYGEAFVLGAIEIAAGRKIEIRNPCVLADVLEPQEVAERIAVAGLPPLSWV
jgi:hypothetical protein